MTSVQAGPTPIHMTNLLDTRSILTAKLFQEREEAWAGVFADGVGMGQLLEW